MKIKSIPDNPTITLSTLNELVREYEKIESNIYDNMPVSFERFLQLLGVQFETGDQAQGHHIDNK